MLDGRLPCCWVRADLCSRCATIEELFESAEGRHWLLRLAVMELLCVYEQIEDLPDVLGRWNCRD